MQHLSLTTAFTPQTTVNSEHTTSQAPSSIEDKDKHKTLREAPLDRSVHTPEHRSVFKMHSKKLPHTMVPYCRPILPEATSTSTTLLVSATPKLLFPNLQTLSPDEAKNRTVWYQRMRPFMETVNKKWLKLAETFMSYSEIDILQHNVFNPKDSLKETQKKKMDAVCHYLCANNSVAVVIEKLKEFKQQAETEDRQHHLYSPYILYAITSMEYIQSVLPKGEAEPEKSVYSLPETSSHQQTVPVPLPTYPKPKSLPSAKKKHYEVSFTPTEYKNLSSNQKEYYACIVSNLAPQAWVCLAAQFMSDDELSQALSGKDIFGSTKKDSMHARMNKICALMIIKSEDKAQIMQHLKKLKEDASTPKNYIRSIDETLSALTDIE